MQELVNFINNVGFPILCVIVMFRQNQETAKAHKEESNKWQEALMNNTLVIQKLVNFLEGENRHE